MWGSLSDTATVSKGENLFPRLDMDKALSELEAAEAEARIAAQHSEMLRTARGEVAHLAVMAATQVAGKRLDTDSDRALAEEFLAKVGEQE